MFILLKKNDSKLDGKLIIRKTIFPRPTPWKVSWRAFASYLKRDRIYVFAHLPQCFDLLSLDADVEEDRLVLRQYNEDMYSTMIEPLSLRLWMLYWLESFIYGPLFLFWRWRWDEDGHRPGPRNYFLALRLRNGTQGPLMMGKDIFPRPMPWSLWVKAILPLKRSPWRFVRVFGLPRPAEEYQVVHLEGKDVVFEAEHRFKIERVTGLIVLEWIIESIYYGTSLKFWRWPIAEKLKRYFTEF